MPVLSAGYSTAFARTQVTRLCIVSPFVWERVCSRDYFMLPYSARCCRVESSPLKQMKIGKASGCGSPREKC